MAELLGLVRVSDTIVVGTISPSDYTVQTQELKLKVSEFGQ